MRVRAFLSSTMLCLLSFLKIHADTLASFTPSGFANVNPNYLGEKFTVSGSGAYSSIAFSFLTTSGGAYAIGTGFLLTQEYLGTPGGLNSGTTGFLGSAASNGNLYSFGGVVTLQGGVTYYFYENALAPASIVAGGAIGSSSPEYYYAVNGGTFVGQPGASAAFSVTGTHPSVSTTPEPSSIALLGTGLLGLSAAVRRRVSHT